MKGHQILSAIAKFIFFIGLAIVIPELIIEEFNFYQFDAQIKMFFVIASGLYGLAHLMKPISNGDNI